MIKKIFIILFSAACCLLPATRCFSADKYVRVAIFQNIDFLRVSAAGPYSIIDGRDKKILSSGKFLDASISASRSGVVIDGIEYKTDKVVIHAPESEAVSVNSRKYRGDIRLFKKDNLRFLVVNDIGLEDYVRGILYHEVSHYWPEEILKAQAIVCRTYALYQAEQSRDKDYDVTNDVYSQVYGGRISERDRTNRAVEATEGVVLVYKGKIFPAYFHATCGGRTEAASSLWNIDIAPLKGVACDFCKESPHFNWHRVMPLNDLKDKLAAAGHKIRGSIKAVEITGRSASGRAVNLKIVTDKDELNIPAKDFRNLLGPNVIKSTNFQASIAGKDAVFEGLGWGHGVGLCQWGGYFMAKEGRSYKEILQYYYPESELLQD